MILYDVYYDGYTLDLVCDELESEDAALEYADIWVADNSGSYERFEYGDTVDFILHVYDYNLDTGERKDIEKRKFTVEAEKPIDMLKEYGTWF